MWKVILTITLCWGAVLTAPSYNDEGLNSLIDSILAKFDASILEGGLDPASLPPVSLNFSDKVLGVTWHGEAMAYDGSLSGMSTVHRTADAQYVFDEAGRVIGVETSMSLNVMEGFYKFLAKFMELGPKGDVEMHIEGIRLSFSAALDEHLCVFSLQKLNIDNIGHIKISIHGLGLLNWIANMFASAIANVVEIFLRGTLENQFTEIFNNVLDNFDLYPYRWLPMIHCDKRINNVMPIPKSNKNH